MLEAAPKTTAASLLSLYGDTFHLQREVIEDAHALTAVIDACGKAGFGDIASTLCLRSSHYLDRAWEITHQRTGPGRRGGQDFVTRLRDIVGACMRITITGSQAMSLTSLPATFRTPVPVLVYAKSGDTCRISARCPQGTTAGVSVTFVRALRRNLRRERRWTPAPGRGDNPLR